MQPDIGICCLPMLEEIFFSHIEASVLRIFAYHLYFAGDTYAGEITYELNIYLPSQKVYSKKN